MSYLEIFNGEDLDWVEIDDVADDPLDDVVVDSAGDLSVESAA